MTVYDGDAEVYDLLARQGERPKQPEEVPPREPLSPCVDCGAFDDAAIIVGYLPSAVGPDLPQLACPLHAYRYVSRSRDLDGLARTRAAVTGESVEQARAVLADGCARSVAACQYCGATLGVCIVRTLPAESGPAYTRRACPSCRSTYGLEVIA